MRPGPNHILRLPKSGTLVKIDTIASGNTFGARFWTDGRREAPMLPDEPWLRRQPVTREMFWTDECEKVAEEEPWGSDEKDYADIPFAKPPTAKNYLRALTSDMAATSEKEKYIRTRLWWACNDPVRRGKPAEPLANGFEDNLLKLRNMLDVSDSNQRLMAAELCREQGKFAAANSLLEFTFPEGYGEAVEIIKKLSRDGDRVVREIK